MELTATITIRRPQPDAYAYWRQFESLPMFMAHLEEVRTTGERTSHWKATAPFDRTVEWNAEITADVPGQRISWRSVGDAVVPNMGQVWFRPAPDGLSTEIRVLMIYDIPIGELGRKVATMFGEEPAQQLDDDLRRFKQVMETGEVVRSDGAPWGRRARKEFPQRPAQPMSPDELARAGAA
jgi:uncharacterized membrane protein